MAIDTSVPRTRRALLAGGIGGLAALIASALGRPLPAQGASGSFDSTNAGIPALTATHLAHTGANAIGVVGRSESTSGMALRGIAEAYSGVTYGLFASSSSTGGTGARGQASAASGATFGVRGDAASTLGTGVLGEATATTGATAGVRGTASSTSGIGVIGRALAASGPAYGVSGLTSSTSGVGVNGWASSTTGLANGVVGTSASSSGNGVVGIASATSGTTIGLAGSAYSPAGTGVRGTAYAPSGATRGVVGRVRSSYGSGVLGYAGSANDPEPSPSTGVYGYSDQSASSRGVVGMTPAGTGVYGYVGASTLPAPPAKTGVYGRSDADAGARGVSGYSVGGSGVQGGTKTGVAGLFAASDSTGLALKTSGRLWLGKVSGVATIPAGANASAVIATDTDIKSSSYVLLAPQSDPGSRRFWAVLDTTANTLTIRTNATSPDAALKVGWLLLG